MSDAEAEFGPPVPDAGLSGYIVRAEPPEACTPIASPPSGDSRTFIALIDRTSQLAGCPFDVKVLNAQRAGYSAVVVHNMHSNNTFPMSGGDCSALVSIPSVLVGDSDGQLLNSYNYS